MDSVLLALRVIVSLAVVLGLMWGLSRVMRGRQSVRGLPIEIVARTPMGKHSSVVIVNVQGRGLVLGVTENSMTMLTEVELQPEPAPAERREVLDLSRELSAGLVPALPSAPPASSASQVAVVTSLPEPVGRRHAEDTSGHAALDGSILSPATWRAMATALRERSVRA
jgi:flagellar protein FliO/FliZ